MHWSLRRAGPEPVGKARMKRKRQQAWRRGRRSEGLARLVLRLAGYRILAHGHRTSPGEIDIIARRGAVLAFVEVKARADFGLAEIGRAHV